ncbi:MAG: hypothetical protein ABFS18_01965 [Thermodesulfobacteriota bacterium]
MTPNQLDLFNRPSFNRLNHDIKAAMNEAVKKSGLSRDQVLDRINELALRFGVRLVGGSGKALTMDTLAKWLNVEEESRVPSFNGLAVFCAAIECNEPLAVMARLLGGKLISDQDVNLLDWARAYHKAKNLKKEMRELEAGIL